MKKILLTLSFVIAFLAIFNSCKKLELAPEDYFGSANYWKNASQVEGAAIGLHANLRNFQFSLFTLGELRGGLMNSGTGGTGSSSLHGQNIITQDLRESNSGISEWMGLYSSIFQVNNFIYNVSKASFLNEGQKSYYLGQAYGMRAFFYFQLFKTFGRLPIVKEPITLINPPSSVQTASVPRTDTEKETLDFIKSDIKLSLDYFGTNEEMKGKKSQWSLYASHMLNAEIYLWSAKVKVDENAPSAVAADVSEARKSLEIVIPKFSLVSDFKNIFSYENKGNSEIIFAMRFVQGESFNNYGQFIYQQSDPMNAFKKENGSPLVPNRFQSDAANEGDPLLIAGSGSVIRYEYNYDKAYMQYDTAKDTRAHATFFDYYKDASKNVMLVKFMGTVVNNIRFYSDDFPVYRLSDALLLLAEAKNKQNQDPSTEINLVRQRAYGTNTYPIFVNGTFEQNEIAIFNERKKEFVGEAKIWFDLRRMQDAVGNPLALRADLGMGVLDPSAELHKLLWPIDRKTLNEDPTLIQNKGYTGT